MPTLDEYLKSHEQSFQDDLCELLRIPSVSADSRHQGDIKKAAEWVAGQFRKLKFDTEVVATAGHPIVFASSPPVPGAPVVPLVPSGSPPVAVPQIA